jgi:hypothetical protein
LEDKVNLERAFKGVWIPKEIWLDDSLGWSEKLLLVEISSLDNEEGCWASNEYFAEFFNLSKDRISKLISSLKSKGYLTVDLTYKKGTKTIDKRIVKIADRYRRKQLEGIGENNDTPIGENAEDNNTSFSNTSNNTKEYIKPSRHKFETCDKEMSELLFTLILENNENAKKPNFDKWANEIRLMREQDKRTEEQIRYLIEWSQRDSFWKSNILSPVKLRKHFDTLVLKVKEDIARQNQQSKEKSKPRAYQSLQDWADEA